MEFKQYPSYKNSGVEWLGDVPEHWNTKPTKYCFKLITDKAIENNSEVLLSVYTDIGVKPRSELEERGNKASTTDGYWIVKKGDIIVNKLLAWMGAIGLSNYSGVTSPAYDILRIKYNYTPEYYNYLFRNGDMFTEFKRYSRGLMDMRLRLYFSEFGNIKLPVPSIDEQQKIVSFLDTETARIDTLIAKQEKLIELLEEQRKSIISHAVTKGLNPDAPMKDSGVEWLGEVPEHWNLKPIKFLAKTNQLTLAENTDENYEIQYVDIGSVSRTNGIEKIETILFKDAPSRARRIVKDGDIIVSTVRTYLKAIAYIENPPKNLIVSTGFAVLNPIRTVIFPQYAKFTFLAEQFIAEVIAKSKGISYPAITATELADIKIALPPLNEQKVILQYLLEENLKMNKLISKQNQLIEKLKEYRSSIMLPPV